MSLDRHLILCGFMACGKTTVGRLLASELGVPFTDTDTLIEQRAGLSIPRIFEDFGEARFRDLEHEETLALPSLSPRVIATGGGLPTFARNRAPLRQAGFVVFIDRDFEAIWQTLSGRRGRPLASGRSREELFALHQARLPFYRACADAVVESRGEAWDCVREILLLMRGQQTTP